MTIKHLVICDKCNKIRKMPRKCGKIEYSKSYLYIPNSWMTLHEPKERHLCFKCSLIYRFKKRKQDANIDAWFNIPIENYEDEE